MVGLAAAETSDPRRSIPTASKQVFWRIALFYVINLFIVGIILPANDPRLLGASGANTKASPFVLAIQDAGIKVLPSIFNAVITISVLSVANSCTFGSTRTMQAMAERGHAPKFLTYIDKKGRPIYCVLIQLAFGLLAYVGEAKKGGTVFDWLLALSGLAFLFVWGSICWAHVRMRAGFKAQGINMNLIPYKTPFGVWGSYIGIFLNLVALLATFYSSLYVSTCQLHNCRNMLTKYQRLLTALPLLPRHSSWASSLDPLFLSCGWDIKSTLAIGHFLSRLATWTFTLAWSCSTRRSPRSHGLWLRCQRDFFMLLSKSLAICPVHARFCAPGFAS